MPDKTQSASAFSDWSGPALTLIGAFGFSAKSIFAKLAYAAGPVDAVTVLALRMLFSLPFFGAMIVWSHRDATQPPLERRDWIAIVWLGFVGYYLASFLDFWGLEYISAGLERLILFTNPTIVVALSALLLGQKITRRTALALALTYGGIVLVFAHDLVVAADTASLLFGGVLVFGSAIAYAVYLIGNGQVIGRIGAARFTAYGMTTSTLFMLVHFALTRSWTSLEQPAVVYWLIAGMAIFSTVLPIWMTNEGIRRIGASRVAMIGTTGPIMTIGLGALMLGEPVTVFHVAGAMLVIGGVALVSVRRPRGRNIRK